MKYIKKIQRKHKVGLNPSKIIQNNFLQQPKVWKIRFIKKKNRSNFAFQDR